MVWSQGHVVTVVSVRDSVGCNSVVFLEHVDDGGDVVVRLFLGTVVVSSVLVVDTGSLGNPCSLRREIRETSQN